MGRVGAPKTRVLSRSPKIDRAAFVKRPHPQKVSPDFSRSRRPAGVGRSEPCPARCAPAVSQPDCHLLAAFRPVTLALVLLALCAWLIIRDHRSGRPTRALWAVPPIVALLINIHLFAFFVVLWLGALTVGEAIAKSPRTAKRYALFTVLSGVALLATPLRPNAKARRRLMPRSFITLSQ